MLQANPQSDPIVEILRFAYRRGLAIRQEQEQKKSLTAAHQTKPMDRKELQPAANNSKGNNSIS
jgi:hypothetical protein